VVAYRPSGRWVVASGVLKCRLAMVACPGSLQAPAINVREFLGPKTQESGLRHSHSRSTDREAAVPPERHSPPLGMEWLHGRGAGPGDRSARIENDAALTQERKKRTKEIFVADGRCCNISIGQYISSLPGTRSLA
jgi:hypothetical protein